MFSNFIYFIIALLIYSIYQPSEKTNFALPETLALFGVLIFIFTYFTRRQFRKLEQGVLTENAYILDYRFNSIIKKQFIMAIVFFAINIYGLDLASFLKDVSFFSIIPTAQALLFISLFLFYLTIVWSSAYKSHCKLYMTDLSKRSYITSNISLSIPIFLPWFLLSGTTDIINALPFKQPKAFLATSEGEIIYFLAMLFTIVTVGPAFIQKFWQCLPLETGYYRSKINNLCKRANLRYADILYLPIFGGKMITAGVMGVIKKFRYILVTKTLLSDLESDEIEAVIAHEIGHVKKKHLLWYPVFFAGYMILSYSLFDLIIYFILYTEPIHKIVDFVGFSHDTVVSIIFNVIMIMLFILYFRYIFGYFMRNFERQADVYVYSLFDNAKPLISTLKKIAEASMQAIDKPNWHHFSIKERIDYLQECETDKTWITKQNNKIKKSITVYLAVMLLVGWIGYSLNFGEAGKRLNKHFFESAIQKELKKTPANPQLYSKLGDISYSVKNYGAAISAYEQSISLEPNSPETLNNLAWLYATCDNVTFRNPKRSIELAKRAARLKKSPHIFDTLAESYYVNGQFEKARSIGIQALKMAENNRSYYEEQLRKFIHAAKKEKSQTNF